VYIISWLIEKSNQKFFDIKKIGCKLEIRKKSNFMLQPKEEFCSCENCPSRGQIGRGNIIIHDSNRGMLQCNFCKIPFAEIKKILFVTFFRKKPVYIFKIYTGFKPYKSTPPKHIYLISKNSSIPYFEPSRPKPLSLMPPNGAKVVEIAPVLMPTMPYSNASPTRQIRA
jgi:hypothetical protein